MGCMITCLAFPIGACGACRGNKEPTKTLFGSLDTVTMSSELMDMNGSQILELLNGVTEGESVRLEVTQNAIKM